MATYYPGLENAEILSLDLLVFRSPENEINCLIHVEESMNISLLRLGNYLKFFVIYEIMN